MVRRILYIGQLWDGGTCLTRLKSLEALGCETVPFDTSSYTAYSHRAVRSIAQRFNIGPPVRELNRDLLQFAQSDLDGITHVWIDKGRWIYPETLKSIRAVTGAGLIHYSPDPHLVFNKSKYFKASIPLYDAIFTTKPFEIDLYRRAGGRNVFLVHQSYDENKLYPRELSIEEKKMFGADISFIGRCERHYARMIKAVKGQGDLRVWGSGWRRYKRLHPWANSVFSGDGVWGDDYARALNATAIGLCFLSKRYAETTTTRTFEIPACGTFMLAERTQEHMALFEEGVEAEYFGGEEELVDKIKFYLHNPIKREQIALAGHERCISSGYSNHYRMQQMLDTVDGIHKPRVED